MGHFSLVIPPLGNKTRRMPVSVHSQIFRRHSFVFFQPLCQGMQVKELPHPLPVFRYTERLMQISHIRRCTAGSFFFRINLPFRIDLLICIRFQIDPQNLVIDFTDRQQYFITCFCALQCLLQFILLSLFLCNDIINMMKSDQYPVIKLYFVDPHHLHLKILLSSHIRDAPVTEIDTLFFCEFLLQIFQIHDFQKLLQIFFSHIIFRISLHRADIIQTFSSLHGNHP